MRRLLAVTLLLASPLLAQRIPLNDLGSARYLGFQGGLYEQGTNHPPADHAAAGLSAAARIVPRDQTGNPSPQGKIALLSIGMSKPRRNSARHRARYARRGRLSARLSPTRLWTRRRSSW